MKKTHNKLTCLFGHHDYSKELTLDKHGNSIHLCKICRRSGYLKLSYEKVFYNYDTKGNLTHKKSSDGFETWYDYDEEGNFICERWEDGTEAWFDKQGYFTHSERRIKKAPIRTSYVN